MRTIRVKEEGTAHSWLWLVAGASIGVVAGVLAARIMGRAEPTAAEDDVDDELEDEEDEEEEEEEEDDDDEEEEDEDDEADDEDPGLDARVLEAFSNDPILAERDIEIEATDDDGILLHGRVRTPHEVKHAVTIARGVPGVTAVRHKLSVHDRV